MAASEEYDDLPEKVKLTLANVTTGTIIDHLKLWRGPVLGLGSYSSLRFHNQDLQANLKVPSENCQPAGEQEDAEMSWSLPFGPQEECQNNLKMVQSTFNAELTQEWGPERKEVENKVNTFQNDICALQQDPLSDEELAALMRRRGCINTQRKQFHNSHSKPIDDDEETPAVPDVVVSAQNGLDVDPPATLDPDVAMVSPRSTSKNMCNSMQDLANNVEHLPSGQSRGTTGIKRSVSFKVMEQKTEKKGSNSRGTSKRHSSAEDRRSNYKESGYGGSSGGLSLETSTDNDVFLEGEAGEKEDGESGTKMSISSPKSSSSELSCGSTKCNSSYFVSRMSAPPRVPEHQKTMMPTSPQSSQHIDLHSPSRYEPVYVGGNIPDWHKLGLFSGVSPSSSLLGSYTVQRKTGTNCGITEADVHIHKVHCPCDGSISTWRCCHSECQDHTKTDQRIPKRQWSSDQSVSSQISPTYMCHCSLPSIQENDSSYKSDSQIEALRKIYLQRLRDQLCRDLSLKGASPEEILAAILPLLSDSEVPCSTSDAAVSLPLSAGSSSPYTDPPYQTSSPGLKNKLNFNIVNNSQESFELQPVFGGPVFEDLPDSSLIERLSMCRSCNYQGCQNTDCVMGTILQQIVEEYMNKRLTYANHHGSVVLQAIATHAEDCYGELKCSVPWCAFFQDHDMPFCEQIARLHQKYFSGLISLSLDPDDGDIYTKLDPKLTNGYQEGVDWVGLSRLGYFSNAVLAVTANTDHLSYWVVKKESQGHTRDMHIEVLGRLSRHRHPRITRHLWLLQQKHYLFVTALFEGGSLADRMSETGLARGLSPSTVLNYLNQLSSALEFLGRPTINVAYLNWTVENVIVNSKFIKLCNFSSAVVIDSDILDEEYIEDLTLILPPRITPPELYASSSVEAKTDIWGLGCLSYHMITGHMIHPEYRHDNPSTIREELQNEENQVPDIRAIQSAAIKGIVASCLQVEPDDRPSATDLRHHILRELAISP